jgi:predicted MPP superfamily phosphohydrolase
MLLLDVYVFQVIKALAAGSTEKARLTIYSIYWVVSISAIILMLLLPYINYENWPKSVRTYVFATIVGLFFAKLMAAIFFLLDDIRRGLMWIMGKIFPGFGVKFVDEGGLINRSAFLSWLGLGIGGTLFGTLIYGFSNKYNYNIKRIRLKYNNLPASFKGLKVVQLSDIHSGSFTDKEAVKKGVTKVLKENADLILFTGDLVNDRATEMHDYIDVFSRLTAPLGVYSTLGNHDYGDYVAWDSPEAKRQNLENLKSIHKQLGWRLLMNEHVSIQKNGETIGLIGIENWSAKARFPKYGRMDVAHSGSENYPFKILMSHDPSHWDAEVRPKYPDVDLMLSGHTHGMQFGFETPFFKWSPVQWVYKQWAGLYEEGRQKLYVNRGYGFIGYPGRVGMLPEITVIELV